MSRREISAGCVVYRTTDNLTEVALIQPRDRKAWALPKGLIEPGEQPEHAAQREAREETGLSGTIVSRIDTIKYSYMAKWEQPATRVFKIVTFYLCKYTEGDRKSTRLNSSHLGISYAVFCLKKKKNNK